MQILKYGLILFGLLFIIPLAMAQEENPNPQARTFVLTAPRSMESIIAEYGCPVGIRDANRHLETSEDGLLAAGQTVLIPLNPLLCEIDYTGAIEFFDMQTEYPHTHWEIAAYFNVCQEALALVNPDRLNFQFLRIPLDTPPCFETVELAAGQNPHNLALELNICENVIWYFNDEAIYEASDEVRPVYIPLDSQACYINGQVLMLEYHPSAAGYYFPAEVVSLAEPMEVRDFAIQEAYCYYDIEAANRGKSPRSTPSEIYIPEGARHCQYLATLSKETSLVDLAREYNVCIETLIAVNPRSNSWTVFAANHPNIWIPLEAPCYDANGLRLGHNDKTVHELSLDDWLFGIAQQYQVCMADLFAANPMLRDYPMTRLPSILFIPELPACSDINGQGFVEHIFRAQDARERSGAGYYHLAYIYNVCELDIILANPALILERPADERDRWDYRLREPRVGESILIPATERPCYDFYTPMVDLGNYHRQGSGYITIQYLCYAQEITPRQDYTGHEPVISPVAESSESYCYDRLANPYLVLDNVTYALYPSYSDAQLFELADCFGVDGYTIVPLTDADLRIASEYPDEVHYWGIPNASRDCPLVGTDREAALSWKRNFYQSAVFGNLNEAGEYGVTYGDTLFGIGRRYGYLPEWIMAENNMTDEWVYPYQRLRLPNYPNIYQMATYGGVPIGGLLLFFAGSFALRLRAKGRKGKKKNDE